MKILLTGISGFVGTNLAERLVQEHEVVGVDMFLPREVFNPVTIVQGDLLNRQFLNKLFEKFTFDVIIHFAAQARVEPSYTDPIGTYRTNVEATINLLEKAKQYNSRFIYASSEIIYGDADRYPCKEHYHLRPDSAYAASKAAGDYLVQQCHGVKSVVLRSGMGFGERSPPSQVITKMMLRCMDGKPLLFPEGQIVYLSSQLRSDADVVVPFKVRHPTRDVNYIKNFVGGVVKVLEKPDVAGVFNMGSGREVDMLTLAEMIIKTVGQGEIKYSSDFHYRPGEEGKRTWLDNTRAKIAFGYDPEYTLEEGLQRTYQWLRDGGREVYSW